MCDAFWILTDHHHWAYVQYKLEQTGTMYCSKTRQMYSTKLKHVSVQCFYMFPGCTGIFDIFWYVLKSSNISYICYGLDVWLIHVREAFEYIAMKRIAGGSTTVVYDVLQWNIQFDSIYFLLKIDNFSNCVQPKNIWEIQ